MEGKVDCKPGASPTCSTKDETAELAEFIQHTKSAAEAGDVVAQNQLGDLYYEGGPGIERNFEEAMVWYSKAAAHGNIDAIYSVAWAYFSGEGVLQSFSDAAVWFEKAVAHCHKKACRNLGKILYFGLGGVPQHVDRGRKLWEQAADLGDAEAAAIIGKLYMEGDTHTPANTEAGVKFLQVAAEQDDGYSMFLLACCYRDGQGVEKNETHALMWFENAREAGFVDVEELYQAALAHHSGNNADYSLLEAVKLFMAAADRGHGKAMGYLCRLYFEGLRRAGKDGQGPDDVVQGFEEPDYKEAHTWGCKAYERGESDVCYTIGQIYELGHGPAGADHQLAAQWYLACLQQACLQQAQQQAQQAQQAQQEGSGREQQCHAHAHCASNASNASHASDNASLHNASLRDDDSHVLLCNACMVALGRCYCKGGAWDANPQTLRIDPDYLRAAYWWRRAAEHGKSAAAMNHLGDLYYTGRGFARDRAQAKHWWQRAASLGHEEAAEGLRTLHRRDASLIERLHLWGPLIVLTLLLVLLFLFFMQQFHEMAKDSWTNRMHGHDSQAQTQPPSPPAPRSSPPPPPTPPPTDAEL